MISRKDYPNIKKTTRKVVSRMCPECSGIMKEIVLFQDFIKVKMFQCSKCGEVVSPNQVNKNKTLYNY